MPPRCQRRRIAALFPSGRKVSGAISAFFRIAVKTFRERDGQKSALPPPGREASHRPLSGRTDLGRPGGDAVPGDHPGSGRGCPGEGRGGADRGAAAWRATSTSPPCMLPWRGASRLRQAWPDAPAPTWPARRTSCAIMLLARRFTAMSRGAVKSTPCPATSGIGSDLPDRPGKPMSMRYWRSFRLC